MMKNKNTAPCAEETVQPEQKRKKRKKVSVANVVIYVILGLVSLFCLLPVVYVILLSFADKNDFYNSTFFVIPRGFHFENYKANFLKGRIPAAFGISVFLAVVRTLYQMLLTVLGAYVFSRKGVPGLKFFFILFLIPMFFGGGLVPFYLTVQKTTGMNNLLSLIIPFGLNGFNMIVLRNFFSAVPDSMIESCRLDGASEIRILTQFILPLSKAGLATIALFYMVETWDDWYWPSLFLTKNTSLYPLALELRQSINNEQSTGLGQGWFDYTKTFSEGINAAMTVIALLPIMAVYPFLQKYFTKGVMVGAVKS